MKRLFLWSSILLSSVLFFTGCKLTTERKEEPFIVSLPAQYTKKVIGFSVDNASAPYCKVLLDYAQWEASKQNVRVIIMDAQSDAQKQFKQIQELIALKVDALCVTPVDYTVISPALDQTKKASIPIVGVSAPKSNTSEFYYDCFVGASMIEEAELAAQSAINLIGESGGNVLILQGPQGHILSTQRTDGFLMAIADYPQIRVVQRLNCELSVEDSHALMKDVLTKNTKIDILYAQDDMLALGAIEAMKAAGMGGEFPVVSIGGSGDGLEAIKRGEMYSTIYQPPDWEGIMSISAAMKLINGEKCDKWVKTPVSLVNKINAAEYKGLW